ncbi:6-hydroxymethylpterin diphosphokinase MptE-like protein [uncultured Pseudodesulfovibrio sp.]|uniref:6-hydroxymethylpterin diphosphokinase MptE-like protein n=1 Tax=uncultured Pseudodesulfovibrio sp. TaxID=2035858 RepID=UPI0029C8FC52|nr:6-hydroxymethylpterin diphosphokinase MptE-like protein [uncultured Pseudodesulfovibrio sp.]
MNSAKLIALEKIGLLARGKDCGGGMKNGDPGKGPHTFYSHHPVWAYESPRCQRPYSGSDEAVFDFLPDGCTLQQAWGKTRLTVFLGAENSPEFHTALAREDTILLLFEPDESRLAALLDILPPTILKRQGLFFLSGHARTFTPPLQEILLEEIFNMGFPVFFASDRIRSDHEAWANDLIEYLEILFFRHRLYPLSGQTNARSLPLRDIYRGLIYDQQLHLYENLCDYLTCPDLSSLQNILEGETAILVAAGPELSRNIDYIADNLDKAVVICVNNALKPLREAGIEPHFVIINDASLHSGQVFDLIEPCEDAILVGHAFSALGGGTFRQKIIFGSELKTPFRERGRLHMHGSVISAAFSLARTLGCTRCVSIGAQLSSLDPWSLRYAAGTVHENDSAIPEKPLTYRYPQLFPVKTPMGDTVYTSLNFRDAAIWLTEEIRISGMEFINTSRHSLLFGPDIRFEERPKLDGTLDRNRLASLHRLSGHDESVSAIREYATQESARWEAVRDNAEALLNHAGGVPVEPGMTLLEKFDKVNVSYLVERFDDFDSEEFHHKVFESDDPAQHRLGLTDYFSKVVEMSNQFLVELKQQQRRMAALK